jgi:hypothetical protein
MTLYQFQVKFSTFYIIIWSSTIRIKVNSCGESVVFYIRIQYSSAHRENGLQVQVL